MRARSQTDPGSFHPALAISPPDQLSHQCGPAGLMAGPEPGAVVAVEVFVERDVIAPVWVGLEDEVVSEHRPTATTRLVLQEEPDQTAGEFVGNLAQVHPAARPGRQLDPQRRTEVSVVLAQRLDQRVVDWEPDRPAPVR